MNKKEVRDKLISNYDNMYSHYKELMKKHFEVYDYEDYQKRMQKTGMNMFKDCVWKYSVKMEEEPAKYVVQLALEKMPEAYYEATRHVEFQKKYTDICPEGDFYKIINGELSIAYFEQTITNYIYQYYRENKDGPSRKDKNYKKQIMKKANLEAHRRWRLEREALLCGPYEGYEEDKTWNWIKSTILPIATRDIWESLHQLFSEDACVPPEDIKKFNKEYERYQSRICGRNDTNKFTQEGDKEVIVNQERKKKTSRNSNINIHSIEKIKDTSVFEKKLLSEKKKISVVDLCYAYYAEKLLLSSMYYQNRYLLFEKNREIFKNAEQEVCDTFIKELRMGCEEIAGKWQIVKEILCGMEDIPMAWKNIIRRMWEIALFRDMDCMRLWMALLYDCHLFHEFISDNGEFWYGLEKYKIHILLQIVRDVIPYDEKSSELDAICKTIYTEAKKRDNWMIWKTVEQEVIQDIIQEENREFASKRLEEFRNEYCHDTDSCANLMKKILIGFDEMMMLRTSKKRSISVEDFEVSSKSVIKSIDILLESIGFFKKNFKDSNALTVIDDNARIVKNKYQYFIDSWKAAMSKEGE